MEPIHTDRVEHSHACVDKGKAAMQVCNTGALDPANHCLNRIRYSPCLPHGIRAGAGSEIAERILPDETNPGYCPRAVTVSPLGHTATSVALNGNIRPFRTALHEGTIHLPS